MKFKGVTKEGNVIEFSPEEKVPVALQDAVIEYPRFKGKEHVWIRDVAIDGVDYNSRGDKLNGAYENNMYSAWGLATFHRRSLKGDTLLTPVRHSFRIRFEDTLDHIGQPDLKVTEFGINDL